MLNLYAKLFEQSFSRFDENWLFSESSDLQRKYDFVLMIAQRVGIS